MRVCAESRIVLQMTRHLDLRRLGQWILGFGIEPILDNAACIHWLLAVLCVEALAVDQEEAQS